MHPPVDRRSVVAWLGTVLALAIAGCAGSGGASSTPGPPPSTCSVVATGASSTPPKGGCSGEPFTAAELRLFLIDQLGSLWYCDRDSYPVGRDELDGMRSTWPDLLADAALADAVRERLGLPALNDPGLTDDQRLQAYRLWKVATAVQLEDIGNGRYRFDYLAQPAAGATEGTRTAGIVDTQGAITVEQQAAAGEPMCPICLALGTLIDVPGGAIAVERLRLGDAVWTLDRDGRRVEGSVIALGSTAAPVDHHVIRMTLADGRTVTASPGHPLADGRRLVDLSLGDAVDGSPVVILQTLPYDARETYDLVVSGDTGIYLAGGIPLGSTLEPGSD
jgi:hypothetical protein